MHRALAARANNSAARDELLEAREGKLETLRKPKRSH